MCETVTGVRVDAAQTCSNGRPDRSVLGHRTAGQGNVGGIFVEQRSLTVSEITSE